MSLSGLIVRRGSIVTVYHALDTPSADGSSVRTYPTNTPDVRMLLEDVSDELLRRVFGAETKATLRALVTDRGVGLLKHALIEVTANAHAGEWYRLDRVLLNDAGASPHRELALAATTERPS